MLTASRWSLVQRILQQDHSVELDKRALGGNVDTTARLSPRQAQAIHIVVCIMSGLSLISTLVTLSWFFQMKRRFRHILIMLLIVADVTRSVFLLASVLESLTRSGIGSMTGFCQATGFFTQVGFEQADLAVLAIAVHTTLQIFRPTIGSIGNRTEESGLYRNRHWVYVAYAVLPPLVSSLAFIRGRYGYASTGVYCSLPIRPFWYRLAISWIPRYIIMLIIAALYVAVYIHVAMQFRSITWLRRIHRPSKQAQPSLVHSSTLYDGIVESPFGRPYSLNQEGPAKGTGSKRASLVGPLNGADCDTRRKTSSGLAPAEPLSFPERSSIATSSTAVPVTNHTDGDYGRDGMTDSITNPSQVHTGKADGPIAPPSAYTPSERSTDFFGRGAMKEEMRRRHQAIQRQIWSLFVYPAIYFLVWLLPFVNHALSYSDYYAQHPKFWLMLLTYTTLPSMGLCDCLVFTLRERPWRHIPGSSGTFWGSLLFWQHGKKRRGSSNSALTLTPKEHPRRRRLAVPRRPHAILPQRRPQML